MKYRIHPRVLPLLAMPLSVLLLLVAPTKAQSQFNYTTNTDGTLTLTSYTGTGGDVAFPTNINGMTVSGLAGNVMLFNSTVTRITIPGSITNIAPFTIYQCSGITNAVLGYGIKSIPYQMFASCVNLSSVSIPDSVSSIGNGAFFGSQVTKVTVPVAVTSIAGVFINCPSLTNVTLPLSITNIDDAFNGCSSLQNVIVPPNITEITPYTFGYCTSLGNILLPSNVTSIDSDAFSYCTGLRSITIPASVTNIAGGSGGYGQDSAFKGCNHLTNLTILGGPNIGTYAFYDLTNLISVSIAGGVVGNYAFQECQNLTTLTFGNLPTTLGTAAFGGCRISSLFIPSNVSYMGNNVFESCNLTNLVIAAGMAAIPNFAFYGNHNLTNVLILGNAPSTDVSSDFGPFGGSPATVYYLPGTTGWSNTFGWTIWFYKGAPTALWNPIIQSSNGLFGVSNGVFGFNITNGSTTNLPVAIMACTNLVNPVWTPLANVMLTNTYYFTDPQSSNYPKRYYGIGFP